MTKESGCLEDLPTSCPKCRGNLIFGYRFGDSSNLICSDCHWNSHRFNLKEYSKTSHGGRMAFVMLQKCMDKLHNGEIKSI